MKPVVPIVSLPVWSELYSAAQSFRSLQPWTILDDTDLICVRDPASGSPGFGVIMGSGGTLFGLCLYRGAEGLEIYRRMMLGGNDFMYDDFFALQNCLKLEYCLRSDLEPEDRTVMKQLNLSFKGRDAWPEFRSLLPGYAPWFLAEDEARFLTLALNVVCHHVNQVNRGEVDKTIRDEECLMYVPVDEAQTDFRPQWEPLPVYTKRRLPPPILNLATIKSLKAKQTKHDTPWEADVFYLPAPILDRERPYYMCLTAITQALSGFAFMAEASPPEITEHQMLTDAICATIEKYALNPEVIFVKGEEEADALAPLARALGLTVRVRKKLGTIRGLRDSLLSSMMSESSAGR